MLHSRHFKAMQFLYFLTLRKFVFLFISIYKTLTSALLPLLFVTSMPTVQTLAVLICALARLDSPGTEKPARVSKIYTPFETYWKSTWVWVTWVVLNCIMWLLWERFWTSFHCSLVKSEKKKSWRPKTNPVYYEKGVACVAGVKRERGRVMWAPPTRAPKPLLPLPLLTPVTQATYATSKSNGHYHKGLQLT